MLAACRWTSGCEGGGILVQLDDVMDAREDKAGRVGERVVFQLPDAIHEDVGRSHRRADETGRAGFPAPRNVCRRR